MDFIKTKPDPDTVPDSKIHEGQIQHSTGLDLGEFVS